MECAKMSVRRLRDPCMPLRAAVGVARFADACDVQLRFEPGKPKPLLDVDMEGKLVVEESPVVGSEERVADQRLDADKLSPGFDITPNLRFSPAEVAELINVVWENWLE